MPVTPLLDRPFLERLERLTLHWQKSFSGLVGGHSPSRFSGSGQEFLDHRNFYQGDDLRSVNWTVYLRLERLFSKVFHLEPRIPMRLLIDTSASMGTGGGTKMQYARKLAAALCYIGLVRLDSITLHPFTSALGESYRSGGGRQRFQPMSDFLSSLEPQGQSQFRHVARDFLDNHDRPGLLMIISDFLSDEDSVSPLDHLAAFGHELFLIQVWDEEDRQPSALGEVELVDAETGTTVSMQIDEAARERYRHAFDEHSSRLRALAEARGGRYLGLSTSPSVEDVFIDQLMRVRGAA